MHIFIDHIVPFLFMFIGFGFLVKGSDLFVEASSKIAKKLGVSQLFIALTIVAMGTSIPETAVSLQAAIEGNPVLSISNIVGTNILNILLILGISSVIMPLTVSGSTICFEIPIMIVTAVIFSFLGLGNDLFSKQCLSSGMLSRLDGCLLMFMFLVYLFYLYVLSQMTKSNKEIALKEVPLKWGKLIFLLVTGFLLIIAGSTITVRYAGKIALSLGVSQKIIGLTIVALGTSLPELATSITAAIKKNPDIAVGNIVGSNIYNMLFIGAVTSLIHPVPYSNTLQYDSLICIGASILLGACILIPGKKRISRISGIMMLLLYGGYIFFILTKN